MAFSGKALRSRKSASARTSSSDKCNTCSCNARPLTQVKLLKTGVTLHPEAVIHPPLNEAHVKTLVHHERSVVEDQIQGQHRVVQSKRRVPKGGVQILARARRQHRKLGLRRQRFSEGQPFILRMHRRRHAMPRVHKHAASQSQVPWNTRRAAPHNHT